MNHNLKLRRFDFSFAESFITKGEPGSFKTREDELQAELERKAVELELAKTQLAEMKAQKELAESAKKLAPSASNKPVLNVKEI